jgi:DNA-binding winged helix-turn-helix (wHTH) protein
LESWEFGLILPANRGSDVATSAQSSSRLRFDSFEVDLRSGEMWKHGTRLRLQDQPFQVLRLLLERRGEIVTREELRQRLWLADTFVDFDDGLNTAVKKIRDLLGDSAERPRYIETIPRRGYRFMAVVESGQGATFPAQPAAVGQRILQHPAAATAAIRRPWLAVTALVRLEVPT